ncbi:MAG: hotdog fold thioesterase [Candidatus Nanopelagicales bacterium]
MTTPSSESPDLDLIAKAVLDGANAAVAGSLMERMEITLDEVSPNRIVASMPVAGNTQPYGLLHGGASAVLAETVGSVGSGIHAAAIGKVPVGIELSCTHHRAARSGRVRAVAVPLSIGRTLATWQITVTDDEDRLICTSRLTCMLREAPPGS